MYLWGDDCTSFSLSPADTLTEVKAALIAAGIVQVEGARERPCAAIINLAAVRAARAREGR